MLQVNNLIGFGARRTSGGAPPATSYANSGGTGDRTATVTMSGTVGIGGGALSNVINGTQADAIWINSANADGVTIIVDFGSGAAKYIDEIKWYQSAGYAQGVWSFQGSNDGSTWTTIATGLSFTAVATTTATFTPLVTTLWRYFQLVKTGGSTSQSPYWRELEFKISA